MKSYVRGKLVEIRCDKCGIATIKPSYNIARSGWMKAGSTRGPGSERGTYTGGWSDDYCPDCWGKYGEEIMLDLDDLADPEGRRNKHPYELMCKTLRLMGLRQKTKRADVWLKKEWPKGSRPRRIIG